jgi:flagellar basal-body rod protein FlgC
MNVHNSLSPIDIAVSGMEAQNKQIEIISSNVANSQTTENGSGEPYRRLEAVFKSTGDISGVELDKIFTDNSDFLKISDPGNPLADANGYVSMPNVNLPVEMMNLNIATRTYQANIATLKRYQEMMQTTLELLK